MTFDPSEFVTELPRRRRYARRILPGALIDREVVSIAHIFAKGAVWFAALGLFARAAWQVLPTLGVHQ